MSVQAGSGDDTSSGGGTNNNHNNDNYGSMAAVVSSPKLVMQRGHEEEEEDDIHHHYHNCSNTELAQESSEERPLLVTLDPDPVVRTNFPHNLFVAPLATLGSALCFPFCILGCCGIFTLNEREHAAVLYCGEYHGSVQSPGLHCLPICGLQLRRIRTATRTVHLKNLKVVDNRGNPVMVSAVVTFVPTSAKKARIDVVTPWPAPSWQPHAGSHNGESSYLQMQAEAVLKQVTSQFPYEASFLGEPSLQTETTQFTQQLMQRLQTRVSITGAHILSFDLVDLSYAPEIAQAMLVRQQATALVDARKVIVNAAVDMTSHAVTSLEDRMMGEEGERLPDHVRNRICTNLLTVVCSHNAVTPMVDVGAGAGEYGGSSGGGSHSNK
jgi:regulator of protease activity HflC (stomatin/prohibitin superfamily)